MDFPAAGYVGRWLPGNMGTDEEKNHGPSFNLDMLKDPVPWREIKHDYTTVSEAVIIPLIPWCSISLLEDHCLIHFLTGTSIECDLDNSSVQQWSESTRGHQWNRLRTGMLRKNWKCWQWSAFDSALQRAFSVITCHHSQECTRDHQGHQHTVYNMFDVRYSQTEAFKLLGKKEWADQSDFTTLLLIILVASFLGRCLRSCLFEFSCLLFSYELSLYIKYKIQYNTITHTHIYIYII